MKKYQRLFYRISQVAALVLVVAWFGWCGLEMNYVYWPRAPQPEIGRTIPHQTKGITVYISKADQEFQNRLIYVMIGAGIIVLLCAGPSEFRRLYPKRKSPQSN